MSPVAVKTFRTIPTTLDLNGPTLSIEDQPDSTTVNVDDDPTFGSVGMAEASLPEGSVDSLTGNLTFQWYQVSGDSGKTAVTNETRTNTNGTTTVIAGAATSILTFTDVQFSEDDNTNYKCEVSYTPSAYGVGKSTGNAWNEPLATNTATLRVTPTLRIVGQPVAVTEATPETTETFNVIVGCDNPDLLSTVTYQWYLNGTALTNSSTISGATNNQLSIKYSEGEHTIYCVVGHTSANPTSIQSNSVAYTVESLQVLYKEIVDHGGVRSSDGVYFSPTVNTSTLHNLANGSMNFSGQTMQVAVDGVSNASPQTFVWAPEDDVEVMIELGGAGGEDYSVAGRGASGGQGGWGVFKLTLKKDQEYTFKLGSKGYKYGPKGGGISGTVNGGVGGGQAIMYKGNQVLACCGGGGGAGFGGGGGDGGGLNEEGENGFGRYGGQGGRASTVSGGSKFSPDTRGGNLSLCPVPTVTSPFPQNLTDCEDYTTSGNYINASSGNEYNGELHTVAGQSEQILFPDTADLKRGFRAGDGGRWSGGWAINGNGGSGGAGRYGGSGSSGDAHGGGGGSGYAALGTDGLEVLRTRSGVNNGNSYAIIHLYDSSNIPNRTAVSDPGVSILQWNDPRALGCKYGWGGTDDQSNPGAYINGPSGSLSDPRGKNWLGEWSNNASFTYQCSGSDENIGYVIFVLHMRKIGSRYYDSNGNPNTQYLTANRGDWSGANGRARKWIAPGNTEQQRSNWIRSNTFTNDQWIYDSTTNPTREQRERKWTASLSEAFVPYRIEFEVELTFGGVPNGRYNRLVYNKNLDINNWGEVKDIDFSSGQLGSANGFGGSDRLELPDSDLAYSTGNSRGYRNISLAGIRSNVINLDGDGNSGWNTIQAFLQTDGRSGTNLSDSDRRNGNGVEFGRTFKG